MKAFRELEQKCNLFEILEKIFKERGVHFEKEKLICDGAVKAAFILGEGETVVDIIDGKMAYFEKAGLRKERQRTKVARELVQKQGFKNYVVISLTEMDFSQDEHVFLDELLFPSK